MNLAWFVYYGSLFGMNKKETLHTLYGEMQDLINCLKIDKGLLVPAEVTSKTYDKSNFAELL